VNLKKIQIRKVLNLVLCEKVENTVKKFSFKKEKFNQYDYNARKPRTLTGVTILSAFFCFTTKTVSALMMGFENKFIKSLQHWLCITLIPLSVY
jgi:hypothetical protein